MFKYIVVGSGFAGAVIAERIASKLKEKVLVIEKRNHVGGNCFDYKDENGILIHKYGPHIFHTEYEDVFRYLSNFTEWDLYHHRVLAFVDGKKVPIPFNFNSIDMLFPEILAKKLQEKLLTRFHYGTKIPIVRLREEQDPDLKFLADFIYEKIFLNYTLKQWGIKPENLDPEVTGRVPVVIGRDDRYFHDRYQVMPKEGYGKLFERMLRNENIKIMLNTDFREVINIDIEDKKIYFFGQEFNGKLIYTGGIDELLNYKYGALPYRSLKFDIRIVEEEFFQEVATVNFPNDYDFTRITEYKHLNFVPVEKTAIAYEYPEDYEVGKVAYYPVFTSQAKENYRRYRELASCFKNLILVGRLAEYRYYDMDDVIKRALEVFEENI